MKKCIKILKVILCMTLIITNFSIVSTPISATSNILNRSDFQLNRRNTVYDTVNNQLNFSFTSIPQVFAKEGDLVDVELTVNPEPIYNNVGINSSNTIELMIVLDKSSALRSDDNYLSNAIKWALAKFGSSFSGHKHVKIGLISYDNQASIDIPLNPVDENQFTWQVQQKLDSFKYDVSSTNLEDALKLTKQQFSNRNGIEQKIVLLSGDSQVNVDFSQKNSTVNELKSQGVELYTIGIANKDTSNFQSLEVYHQNYTGSLERYEVLNSGYIWDLEKRLLPQVVSDTKYNNTFGKEINSYEIFILLDTSSSLSGIERQSIVWPIVNFVNNYKDSNNVKVGLISFNNEADIIADLNQPTFENFQQKLENHLWSHPTNASQANITSALKKANERFSSDKKVFKQIVLISGANNLKITEDLDSIANSLKDKQVDMFTYMFKSWGDYQTNQLLTVHQKVMDYNQLNFYDITSNQYNLWILQNDYFQRLQLLNEKLLSKGYTPLTFSGGNLIIQLDDSFRYKWCNLNCYLNGNVLNITLPTITYNTLDGITYYANPISIVIGFDVTTAGKYTFGNSYLTINNQNFSNINLPTIYVQSKGTDDNQFYDNSIRILEIQPGNDFKLKGQSNLWSTGIDTYNYHDKTIVIEHITMPEFIGKITQLNGYYDVIVIGNNSSWDKKYSQINLLSNNNSDYNENDITERKADEIIKFIESGQLVYMDESILTDSNLKQSNLYKKFNSIVTDNFKKFKNWELGNESILSIDKIISDYMDEVIKKSPKFSITKLPNSDSQESNSGQIANRHMEFELDIPEEAEGYQLTLFLDINGDGLYREDEIVKVIERVTASSTYQFSYEMDPYFVGKIDWKIELTSRLNNKGEAIKSYSLGSTYFKNTSQTKLPIKVLQVYSYRRYEDAQNDQQHRNNEASNLLLSSEKFQNIVNEQSDYEINVTEVPASFFNECAGKEVCIYKGQSYDGIQLNGNYDMIIFGFGDYPADISSETAINEIKSFIQSGQSVMFTHDNFGDKELLDWLKNTTGFSSHIFSDSLRTFIGQARFKGNDNIIRNLYQSYDTVQKRYDYLEIPLLNIGDKINSIDGLSTARPSLGHNNQVYKTNEALITTYPFIIDNIQVAQTHRQYFQLNLEDPDVVPWLNLANNGGYDSKNEYYTYSKGNITFSGTGHRDGYTDDELRLFVNTIVKAGRGANHAPIIESSLDDLPGTGDASTSIKYIDITPNEDFPFNMIVRDIDGDDVTVTITIDNEIYSETVAQGTKIDKIIPASSVVVNQPIIIKLQAKDKNQAQATPKVYQLNPVEFEQPTIKFISQNLEYRALAGDIIDVDLEFEKIFDDNDQIEIQDVELTTFNDGVLQVISGGQPIQVSPNKVFLSYQLMPLGTMQNEKVLGKLRYKIKGSDTFDETIFSFTISALSGSATIKLIDENGNPYKYQATAKLSNEKTEWEPVVLDALGMSEYAWNNKEDKYLNSSNYQMELELPNGYEVKSIKEGDTIVNGSFILSYDNPTVNRIYTIGLASDIDTTNNLIHGLDEGVRNGQLQVTEGAVQLISSSYTNLLARVRILHNQESVYLNIDKKFIDSNALAEKIKVYKWENNSLLEIIDVSVNYIESNSNQEIYVINFRNTAITDETDIVIKYPVQLNSDENTYINNVLYTIDGNVLQKEFKIETAELPDLF